jgi:hypothetical protein
MPSDSPLGRALATRSLIMLMIGTAVSLSLSLANAQGVVESPPMSKTISTEDIKNLPGKKANISELISVLPPANPSPVILSKGTAGFNTDVKTPAGLNTIIFKTPAGDTLEVYLPNHLTQDSSFTATMKLIPANGQVTKSDDYHLLIQDQLFPATTGRFNVNLLAGDTGRLILIDKKGKGVAGVQVPLFAKGDLPLFTIAPTAGTSGEVIKIDCPATGLIRSDDYVKIGGHEVPILAGARGSLVILNDYSTPGLTEIEISLSGIVTKKEFRNITLKLSADKLNLIKGESTVVHIAVSGLEKLKAPAVMTVDASGPVSMGGGNSQTITIDPAAVTADGTYTTAETLFANSAGTFGIKVTVTADDKK